MVLPNPLSCRPSLRLAPACGGNQRAKPSRNTQPSHAQDRPAPRCSRRARGETGTQNRSGRQVGAHQHRGPGQETARRVRLSCRLPGCRANTTEAPGKFSRAVRIMTDAARRYAAQTPPPAAFTGPPRAYRGPRQQTPGSPTRLTGVPNKNYRGVGQILPGCPTSRTGVPDKSQSINPCKRIFFRNVFGWPCS